MRAWDSWQRKIREHIPEIFTEKSETTCHIALVAFIFLEGNCENPLNFPGIKLMTCTCIDKFQRTEFFNFFQAALKSIVINCQSLGTVRKGSLSHITNIAFPQLTRPDISYGWLVA